MHGICILFAVLVLKGSASESSNFRLEATPRTIHIRFNEAADILCKALDAANNPVPLSKCQIYGDKIKLNDLSDGPNPTRHLNYTYHGTGLQNGDCGITVGADRLRWLQFNYFECRVRNASGGEWHYASILVHRDVFSFTLAFNLQPRGIEVSEGSDVTIRGSSDQQFEWCDFVSRGKEGLKFHPNNNQSSCDISLRNVSSALNGYIIGWAWQRRSTQLLRKLRPMEKLPRFTIDSGQDFVRLIVRAAPEAPKLSLDNAAAEYKEGDILRATCIVANSRPVSNLTWLLGDTVVRQDTTDESPVDDTKWRWSFDLQNITQHLTRTLKREDDGKELICRAGHVALPSGMSSTSILISVEYQQSIQWTWIFAVLLGLAAVAGIAFFTRGRCPVAKSNLGVFFKSGYEHTDDVAFVH